MIIPNAEQAVVDIRKLRDYCLNPQHDDGKHKARLFVAALGITADDAEALREVLLEQVKVGEAALQRRDAYGQRYALDFMLEWKGRRALVRSGWILEHGSNTPKMTTCYPL
jgi:hypothetical protein